MRRGNGDGSIFKLSGKRRKPFAVRITVGYTNEGKQQYRYIGYYQNKTEAKKALNEYLVNQNNVIIETQTLKCIFEKMIEKSNFSEGTKQQYVSGFNQLKMLHNRNIKDISLTELEDIVADHLPSTQGKIKRALSNCYKYAMRYDYVDKNIAEFILVEKKQPKEKNIFTCEEIHKLWENVGSRRFDDVPLILLYSGLRISELLQLKNENVDLTNKTMFIEKSKTPAGVRTVPIHDKILPLIEKRYNEKNEHLISVNGRQMTYNNFNMNHWRQDHTIHETRHTFITNISKATNDKIAIKKIVGHVIDDMTDHYTHRTIDELNEAINKVVY